MTRTILALVLCLMLGGMAAADCEQHIAALWATVQASDLSNTEKSEVGNLLQNARQKALDGDEEACIDAVRKLRMALNMH